MGLKKFTVEILDNNKCFFPGQTVSGDVHVQCLSDEVIKEITVTIKGKATVEILQSLTDSTPLAEEVYINSSTTVVDNSIIREGEHNYPFKFTLPHGIPSSFRFKETCVTYNVEAVLKRFTKFDKKAKKEFGVIGLLDLIKAPNCFQKLDEKFYENFGLFGYGSGLIGFHINLPQRGFVPGQFIKFEATFSNHSKFHLSPVSAALVQKVTYEAKGTNRSFSHKICKAEGPYVPAGQTEVWSGSIRVPLVPVTNLGGGKIIELDYFVQIVIRRPFTSGQMKKVFPITIGNMLGHRKMTRNDFDSLPPCPIKTDLDNSLSPSHSPSSSSDSSSELKSLCTTSTLSSHTNNHHHPPDPPSYEEAIISADLYTDPFTLSNQKTCQHQDQDHDDSLCQVETDYDDDDSEYDEDETQVPKYVAFSWLVPNYTSRRYSNKKSIEN